MTGYLNTIDEYYPSSGLEVPIIFEGSNDIFKSMEELANLDVRLAGKSDAPYYIAEPTSEETYRNVMSGFSSYLNSTGSISGIILDQYNWPTTEADFVTELAAYTTFGAPGQRYINDISFNDTMTSMKAIRVNMKYVLLTKMKGSNVIQDADKEIEAMETTRDLIDSWDDLPSAFPYSEKFFAIEGFKVIKKELFLNVGLAVAGVALIVLVTVASPLTAFIITLNVGFCLLEILGTMSALGIAVDSISVINIVLAVGLSIDYSAHVGHCFMVKGGDDKNKRALEALADIGSAVLSAALTTFLSVVVLLFSSSYLFQTLAVQFALTGKFLLIKFICFYYVLLTKRFTVVSHMIVGYGATHGLILLPVLLSIFGPKAFESARTEEGTNESKVQPEYVDN